MLKAVDRGSYRKQSGQLVFRYAVTGSKAEMSAFEEAQGEYHKIDEKSGEVLWFTPRYVGKQCNLIITDSGNVVADTSELDRQTSLLSQVDDPTLKQALADNIAKAMLANNGGGSSRQTQAPASQEPESVPETSDEQSDMGNA